MKHLFLLIIFYLIMSANPIQFNKYINNKKFLYKWKYILHLENKNFSKINEYFYLSYPNITLLNELILDLNEIKNNKKFVCEFPFRYLFLKKYFDLPKYDLKNCKKLQHFYNNFSKSKVGIIFSAEYASSPQSSFGHVMLIFKNKNSFLNSDVVHFAAKSNLHDGFFIYSFKGLFGKYDAYYLREKLFRKYYLYNIKQQRTMYIYWLNFNKKDIRLLIYYLYELRKFKAKYYFTSLNCSSALIEILKVIKPKINDNFNYVFLPIDTIKRLNKYIEKVQILPSLEIQVVLLAKKLSKKDKQIFDNIVTLKNLNYNYKNFSNSLKELLNKYYLYKFYKYHYVYPNYNQVTKLNYKESKIDYKSIIKSPLKRTQPSEIFIKKYNKNLYYFEFRPFLIGINDQQKFNKLDKKIYKIFYIQIFYKKNHIKLQRFDLFNLKSLNINYSPYLKPFSWGFYLGLNRENKKSYLLFNSELNYGYTYNSIFNSIISLLGGIGFYLRNKNYFYIKPEIYFIKYFNKSSLIIHSYYKYLEDYYNFKISYNIYYKNYIFSIGKELNNNESKIYLGIGYNF